LAVAFERVLREPFHRITVKLTEYNRAELCEIFESAHPYHFETVNCLEPNEAEMFLFDKETRIELLPNLKKIEPE